MFSTKTIARLGLTAIAALMIGGAGLSNQVYARTVAATAAPTMAAPTNSAWPRTIADQTANQVTLKAKALHIISATLATDEMLLSLVDSSRLTAITVNASDPGQSNMVDVAKTIKTQLKTPLDPEQIIALKPDLVLLASYNDAAAVKQLKNAGLTLFTFANFNSIKDIEANITLLGQVVGEEGKAAALVNDMETRLKTVADAVKSVKPLTVLYYSPDGGYSDGPGSTTDEVLTRAGAINAVTAGGIKDAYPTLSKEFIVKADPDVILLSGAPGVVDAFSTDPAFKDLKAVKAKQVYAANDAQIGSISQYIVNGVEDVAALLYPNAYKLPAAATPAATMSATAAK
jgi:iron complex transport system substrate-binding protein